MTRRKTALCRGDNNDDDSFKCDQPEHTVDVRVVGCRRCDYAIDDEFANPGDGGRQDTGDQCQQRNRDCQRLARRPYELDSAPAVAEYTKCTPEESGF
ncbi:MAG: hypothetical protein AAFN50_12370 [Pseudomonadota bacterium]